jgi:hypothetical protein
VPGAVGRRRQRPKTGGDAVAEEFVLLPAPRQRTWRTLHNSGCDNHLTLLELLVRQVQLDAIGQAIPIMVTVPLPMGSMYLAEHEVAAEDVVHDVQGIMIGSMPPTTDVTAP